MLPIVTNLIGTSLEHPRTTLNHNMNIFTAIRIALLPSGVQHGLNIEYRLDSKSGQLMSTTYKFPNLADDCWL